MKKSLADIEKEFEDKAKALRQTNMSEALMEEERINLNRERNRKENLRFSTRINAFSSASGFIRVVEDEDDVPFDGLRIIDLTNG